MSKKKLTNREITDILGKLSQNDQVLWKEILEIKQLFSLYLEYRNKTHKEQQNEFNDFVRTKVEEFERQQLKDKT